MTSGAMVIGAGPGDVFRAVADDPDLRTLFSAMQNYITTGRPTVIYAYYPDLDYFDAIPARIRDSYLEEHDNV